MPVRVPSRRTLSIGVAAILVALVGGFFWWWSHPALFLDVNASEWLEAQPLAHAAFSSSVTFPPQSGGEVITLNSATAHFSENSAQAHATFVVCRGLIGGAGADLSKVCTSVRQLPTTFRYLPESKDSVVIVITPTRAGRATVDAVTLNYDEGGSALWRQGSQTIAVSVGTTAR